MRENIDRNIGQADDDVESLSRLDKVGLDMVGTCFAAAGAEIVNPAALKYTLGIIATGFFVDCARNAVIYVRDAYAETAQQNRS
jgi:hypothetical protein